MMHPRLRIPLALGILTAVGVLAAASALGGNNVKRWESRVTLAVKDPFHGRVNSLNHSCESRNVKVFKKKPGHNSNMGGTTTDSQGKWSIEPPTLNGKFYAKVIRLNDTAPACRPDLSPVREFGT
jgi:hypothetical protein